MADTKISALTGASAAAGANELPINEAGTSKKLTVTQIQTFVNNAPVFAAGTASAGTWPVHTSGTLLTAAVAGTIETDTTNFYLTTEASNRGIVPIEYFIRANTTRTFTSNTTQQSIFTTPTNGALTLPVGVYEFNALVGMTAMSATSGNAKFSLIGAGTATLTQVLWTGTGIDIGADGGAGGAAVSGIWSENTTQTATNLVGASIGTGAIFLLQGTFNVSVTGTVIPSFALTTAATAVVEIGSYFKCKRFGAQAVTSVGNWG